MKIVTLLILSAMLPASLSAQIAGGGGDDERDNNPWNPANWRTELVSRSGTDVAYDWALLPNGSYGVRVRSTSWSISATLPEAQNYTNSPQNVRMTSSGTVTRRIVWQGVGNPPAKVVVRIGSTAFYDGAPGGSGHANNGLGTPTVLTVTPNSYTGIASAVAVRELALSNGSATVTLSKSAEASSFGNYSTAEAGARDFTLAPANREVTINADFEPTYVMGLHDQPVLKTHDDLTNKEVWTALTHFNSDGSSTWNGGYMAQLLGAWTQPYSYNPSHQTYSWYWTSAPWYHPETRQVPASQIASMINGNPIIINTNLTVTNIPDGIARSAKIKTLVYPPRMLPSTTWDGELEGQFWAASPYKVVSRWETQPATITMTKNQVDSVTTGYSLSLGAEVGAKFGELYSAAIKPSGTWNYGETASISTTIADARTVSPDPAADWEYWWERAKVWRRRTGTDYMYNRNGYAGRGTWIVDYFRSATKEDAAANDYRDIFQRRVYAP